jgi:hypothetical protein
MRAIGAILTIPSAGAAFFFSAWLLMIFWGIVADDIGVQTMSYRTAMIATIGLWMTVAPLIAVIARRRRKWGE